MSAIFLSHSSADNEIAAEVRARLAAIGHRSVFLDFDPEDGIPAGRDWEQELYRQLRACRAVIVLCSQRSMASRWCFAEITHARALGKQIFPLKVDATSVDSILGDHQILDLTGDRDEAFRRLERGLAAAGIDAADPFDWDGSRSPYPGLLAFQEEDAAIFFGRDEEIGAGLDALNQITWQGGPGLLLILGASGSGKSSLLRAGLLPRLRRNPERWLVVPPFRPGERPSSELAAALAAVFRRHGEQRDPPALAGDLELAATGAAGAEAPLRRLVEELRLAAGRPEARVLVIVDQLEELLGHPEDHPASAFLALLRAAGELAGCPLVVVATMRSDFLSALQKAPALRHAELKSLSVGPMAPAGLAEVIERPAALAGLELEPGLVQAILADTETEDALPLMAFALNRLYTRHATDGRMRLADYRDRLGGLQGAIAQAADGVLAEAALPAEQEEALRRVFLAMVRVNQEGRFARRPLPARELPEAVRPLVERFVRARLLVLRGDGADAVLEVAHEALFESWGRLDGWLQENRAALLLHGELHHSARRWLEEERADGYLWRGGRLHRALELRERDLLQMTAGERDFLDASERAERLEGQRRRRMRRLVVATSVVMALSMAALALVSWQGRRREAEQRRASEVQASRILAVEALNNLDDTLDVGLLLALEAAKVDDTYESRTGLLAGLSANPRLDTFLFGHWDLVWGVDLQPGGRTLASGSSDGTVRLWDMASRRQVRVLEPYAGRVLDVAFSADGDRLASGHNDGTIRLWDPATGAPGAVLAGSGRVLDLELSPDGAAIASGGSAGEIRLWQLASGEPLWTQGGHEGWVWNTVFSPDGEILASAGDDGTVRLWKAATGEPHGEPLRGPPGIIHSVRFAPGGERLASGQEDGVIRLWELARRRLEAELPGHRGEIRGLAFSPDGARLASASVDRTVRVWDLAGRRELAVLGPHVGGAWDVAFGADGRTLVSTDGNGTIFVWDLARREPGFSFGGHTERVSAVAFAADGNAAASGDLDGHLRLWEVAAGELAGELPSQGGEVTGLAFSPDGGRLATVGASERLRIWSLPEGELEHERADQPSWPWAVAFSPDGGTVAAGADDGTVRLWDATSGLPGLLFRTRDASGVRSLAFSPDGRTLAAGTDAGPIQLWNPRTGEPGPILEGHPEAATALAFGPDGRLLASGSPEAYVRLWSLPDGGLRHLLKGHQASIGSLAFDARGATLASGAVDGVIRIWDPVAGEPRFGLLGHTAPVLDLEFAPSGALLSGDEDGHARVWDVELPAAMAERACGRANRNLTSDEWAQYFGATPYRKTCPDLPHGDETWQ